MIETPQPDGKVSVKQIGLMVAARGAAVVAAAGLSFAFFGGDRPVSQSADSVGDYVLNSGTATVQDLGSYAWQVDPSIVQLIARRSALYHVSADEQPLVQAFVKAEVFLELFQDRTDMQLYFRPALRGAAVQALAQASEQSAKYCNRLRLQGATPDSNLVTMPLYFLYAANVIKDLRESDLTLHWAKIADQSEVAVDENPTRNLLELSRAVRSSIAPLLARLAVSDSLNSAGL
ncbi:MAG: hypothetical protein K1X83_11245 [Oligoflexia bacterium]|nr:hypothetical protein [Oligoflexia bacterium]